MYKNTPENKMLCCLIAGHYHFASNHYKRIIEKLEKYEDIHESIVNSLTDIICHYLS
jgi:effector-binding domain-containing protein